MKMARDAATEEALSYHDISARPDHWGMINTTTWPIKQHGWQCQRDTAKGEPRGGRRGPARSRSAFFPARPSVNGFQWRNHLESLSFFPVSRVSSAQNRQRPWLSRAPYDRVSSHVRMQREVHVQVLCAPWRTASGSTKGDINPLPIASTRIKKKREKRYRGRQKERKRQSEWEKERHTPRPRLGTRINVRSVVFGEREQNERTWNKKNPERRPIHVTDTCGSHEKQSAKCRAEPSKRSLNYRFSNSSYCKFSFVYFLVNRISRWMIRRLEIKADI